MWLIFSCRRSSTGLLYISSGEVRESQEWQSELDGDTNLFNAIKSQNSQKCFKEISGTSERKILHSLLSAWEGFVCLFYRRKSMSLPTVAWNNTIYYLIIPFSACVDISHIAFHSKKHFYCPVLRIFSCLGIQFLAGPYDCVGWSEQLLHKCHRHCARPHRITQVKPKAEQWLSVLVNSQDKAERTSD